MDEIERLKREIAGLEAVLAHLTKAHPWWMLAAAIVGALFGFLLGTALVDPVTVLVGCGGIQT